MSNASVWEDPAGTAWKVGEAQEGKIGVAAQVPPSDAPPLAAVVAAVREGQPLLSRGLDG